ncbi:MAG: TRAP transporter substrate-binding protein [Burkholderiales bacterium]|nr:TRAP transporter substrate-binding protein [Burkholderiales bacterium]
MTRLARTLASIALVALPTAHAQIVLDVNSWVPAAHPMMADMTMPYCKDIESVTQGRVVCRVLPKAVSAPPQTFDSIRDGLADLAFTVHGYTPSRFVFSEVAEFPFMADSAEVMSVAYQRIYERMLARFDEHKGVVTLAVFTHGPGQIYNTRRPVTTLRDLEGMKLRVGGGMVNEVAKAIGATPVLRPATDSYEMMASGVVDGTLLPKETPVGLKLMPLVKHATYVPGGLYNVSFLIMANPAKWNSISAADREAINRISGEALARRFGRAWDLADGRGQKAVVDTNIPTVTASPQFMADIRARTAGLEQAWIDKARARGGDGRAILDALRAEINALARR